MSAVEFTYCKFNETLTACDCNNPCLLVTLTYGHSAITVEALVDSGCTRTLADLSLAEQIGVDLQTCTKTKVGGVGGEVEGYMTTIGFQVQEFDNATQGSVIFVKDLPVTVLLGQLDFFEHYHIHFKKSEHCFSLEKVV